MASESGAYTQAAGQVRASVLLCLFVLGYTGAFGACFAMVHIDYFSLSQG